MTIAAGILFVTPQKTALFLKRGPGGDHPGEWCFPGGHREEGETIEECAVREAKEECGSIPKGDRVLWTRTAGPSVGSQAVEPIPGALRPEGAAPLAVDFSTYLQTIAEEFVPKVNDEHVGYAWAPINSPPQPLHPGAEVALARFTMDELGVAQAIRDGRLCSPQKYENVWLFALRITGTGVAYRRSWDEFVWRNPDLYMNEEFLARCNGLSVIMEHPKGAVLNSKEFSDRIIGSILLPYLKPETAEVWGVAKIYDEPAAIMMTERQLSTSPSVVFRDPTVNNSMEMENGSRLLIEGKPSLVDHLAICEQGVWDKGEKPRGVLTAAIGDSQMTEEEKRAAEQKAREDAEREKARADADARRDATLDKLLTGVDAIMSACDALTKRMDAVEEKIKDDDDDDDDDDARKDDAKAFSKRKDDDDDDAYKKRHDAEEGELAKKLEGEGKPKEKAADRAKRARKDAEEGEEKEREEEKKAADKKRKDAEEAKKVADAAAAAANNIPASVVAEIKRVEALIPKQMSDADYRAMADAQERADHVFSAFGDYAPRPMQGEDLLAYRRRLAGKLQPHSAAWKEVDLSKIADEAAFKSIESAIYADAARAAERPTDIPKGQLREIKRADQTGRVVSTFVGQDSFVQAFKQPVRRISRLNTNFRDR